MNWLDILILVTLIISAIGGLITGLIKTIFSLVGLILGVVLAGRFYVDFAGVLGFLPGDRAPRIAAVIIILLAVMLAAALLGILLTKVISAVKLGWLNRMGGAVLGIFLGAIFVASLLVIWVKVASPDVVANSKIAVVLLDKLPFIMGLLPSEFDAMESYILQNKSTIFEKISL